LVTGLLFFTACRSPINMDGIFPAPVPMRRAGPPPVGEKFLPAHRRILEMTGWYDYAASNIDAVEYFDWQNFSHPRGPAIGLAAYARGLRIAQIAISNRSDAEICETIVHEAAHLSGIQQIGEMFDEEEAEAAGARFWQKWQSLNQR